jgi:hypothetical protein
VGFGKGKELVSVKCVRHSRDLRWVSVRIDDLLIRLGRKV